MPRSLETILQHQQGLDPSGFDHAFNLGCTRERTDAHPPAKALRETLDERTRRLVEGDGVPPRTPPPEPSR